MAEMGREKFLEIFSNSTETKLGEYSMASRLIDIEAWDSIAVLNFIALVEDSFGVIVSPDRIGESVTLQDLYDAVGNSG